MGLFWLLVNIASYFTNGTTYAFTKRVASFPFIAIFIAAMIKNRPKKSFSYQIGDTDNVIEVKVGNAFKNHGYLVIPFNDCFDTSLGSNVEESNSLQSQLIKDFYSNKPEHLAADISKKIDCSLSPHDIGTTIEIKQKNKGFYLLVNSRKKPNNRVESSKDDFRLSLSKLWEHISSESGRNIVTIPLINTLHGRITDFTKAIAIKKIIYSYIDSSQSQNITDKLIISIYPNDVLKGKINLDDINEYLKFLCKNYKIIKFFNKLEEE